MVTVESNRLAEKALDAAVMQKTAGVAILIPLGLILTFGGTSYVGIPMLAAGLLSIGRGAENLHKHYLLERNLPLPKIRTRRFGRIIYP